MAKNTALINVYKVAIFINEGTVYHLPYLLSMQSLILNPNITCCVYGTTKTKASLFEDDGIFNYEQGNYNMIKLLGNKSK